MDPVSGSQGPSREPAVAGQFYPGTPDVLQREVASFLTPGETIPGSLGAVMPHAGYVYSGAVAGETASALDIPEKLLVLGPNHTGLGPAISVYPGGAWHMPFGRVPVDARLARAVMDRCPDARPDTAAHQKEHSIEVQLPILFHRRAAPFAFVPITLGILSLDTCRTLAEALAEVIQAAGEPVLMVASSDMTHYENRDAARTRDAAAIERILDLDPEGLYDTVRSRRISMCGVVPATVMLFAAKRLGAGGARLIRYANSGDVSGDYEHVVGYAGLVVHK